MWRLRWLKSTFKIPSDLVLAIARTHLSAASKGGLNANPQPTQPTLNQHDNVCFTPKSGTDTAGASGKPHKPHLFYTFA